MSYQPVPTHESDRTELRIEDDFCFKNNVLNADKDQRLNFLRKVYAILCAQIGLTSLICGLSITNLTIKTFIQSHIDLVPMVSQRAFFAKNPGQTYTIFRVFFVYSTVIPTIFNVRILLVSIISFNIFINSVKYCRYHCRINKKIP